MGAWLLTNWTKTDQSMLEVLLIAGLVLTGLLTVPLVLRGATYEPTLEADLAVPVELPGVGTVDAAPVRVGDIAIAGPMTAQVTLLEPTPGERLAYLAPQLAGALLAMAVLFLLLRVVQTLPSGDVLSIANARRLTVVALLVGVGSYLVLFAEAGVRMALLDGSAARDVTLAFAAEFSFAPLVGGLLVAAIAQVFRQGAALRADLEGVV